MLLSLKLLQLCINGFCICVKCGSASKGKFCLIIVLTCVKIACESFCKLGGGQMKIVIQRVSDACVKVAGEVVGSIEKGFVILFGVGQGDSEADCTRLAEKISKLRIFEDDAGKTNLSLKDVSGRVLSISQFTLLADCSHGNRPSFINAAPPEQAKKLYELFNSELRARGLDVETGIFGADMKVSLTNDGPFTVILE